MTKCFVLSLAIHSFALGGILYVSTLPGPDFEFEGAEDFAFVGGDDAPSQDEGIAALNIPLPEGAVSVAKAMSPSPTGTVYVRQAAAEGMEIPRQPPRPPVLVGMRKAPVSQFDVAEAIEAARPASGANLAKLLEHDMGRVEKIPEKHLDEITTKLRNEMGVENTSYEPRHESTKAGEMDFDHSVVFYRLTKKKDQSFFQELLLDRKGNYMVVREKPEADMDFSERMKLKFFSNSAMKSVRNLTLGIVEKQANEQENKSRP